MRGKCGLMSSGLRCVNSVLWVFLVGLPLLISGCSTKNASENMAERQVGKCDFSAQKCYDDYTDASERLMSFGHKDHYVAALEIVRNGGDLASPLNTSEEVCYNLDLDADEIKFGEFKVALLDLCRSGLWSNDTDLFFDTAKKFRSYLADSNCFLDGRPVLSDGGLPVSLKECRVVGLDVVRFYHLYFDLMTNDKAPSKRVSPHFTSEEVKLTAMNLLPSYFDLNFKLDPPLYPDVHDEFGVTQNSLSMKIKFLSAEAYLMARK